MTDDAKMYAALNGATDTMGDLISRRCPKPPGCETWVYRDLPWMTVDQWDAICDVIGTDHARLLAATQRGIEARGQLWVSPEGAERLTAYSQRYKN